MQQYKVFVLVVLLSLLAACDNKQQADIILQAVDVDDAEECHLCGMFVSRFAGPKGQSYLRRQQTPSHFCSTRDLFAYLLQPDVAPNIAKVFVHDMGKTDWHNPAHTQTVYIDATTAYYVIGHSQKGAMGHTIGSFADKQTAQNFIQKFGGRVLRYQDITLDMLNQLGRG
jgi:copper chaperone NosL